MDDIGNYMRMLSDDDKELLLYYTREEYIKINNALRKNTLNDILRNGMSIKEYIGEIDRVFLNAPALRSPLTVYRGVRFDKPDFKKFKADSYHSTSLDRKVAMDFVGNCCLLEITVVPGTKILVLDEISDHPNEKEILLNRKTELIFNNTSIEDQIYTFYLTAMDHGIPVKDSDDLLRAEKKANIDLINDRVVEYVNSIVQDPDFDPEFDDPDVEIKATYKRIVGRDVPDDVFLDIKKRIKING